MKNTDFELLKNSDPAALERIHSRYSTTIYWIGKRWIDDEFVLESLVQNAFLKLWNYRDKIESPGHIFFFLRIVMNTECFSHYNNPRNKFYKVVKSIEDYGNYQDYMVGYDPAHDVKDMEDRRAEQKRFDKVKKVLPLLSTKRRRLIELCLKNGFQYKAIGAVMGTGTIETSKEVKRAIEDLRNILLKGGISTVKKNGDAGMKVQGVMTEEQKRIYELRCKEKQSFGSIAALLNLSQKEVHKNFVTAHKLTHAAQEEQLASV